MSYNNEEFPQYVKTAGKITVITALVGMFVFIAAFMVDIGKQELSKVSAQTATTTLTVLNTPPEFTVFPYEVVESSTSSPTNSFTSIQWAAVGTDSNSAPYFLLVCSTNASPTANAATSSFNLGSAPPVCGGGTQWGVSTSTVSGELATVSTTTSESAPFAELNEWFAWVCDDDPNSPRCNTVPSQGLYATSSSPFHVNFRPVLSLAANDGPVDPGDIINFLSTSTDPDIVGGEDNIFITICGTSSNYDSVTDTCSDYIASSTAGVTADAFTSRTIGIPTRDQTYPAFAYIYDEHGHEASANPIDVSFDINNVAPYVLGGNIELYGQAGVGSDLTVTVPAGETPSSTLNFTIQDNNSCLTAASSSEITGYQFSVFRSGVGTTTCDTTATNYDPNSCYPSGIGTSTWSYSCTATTTCASPNQTGIEYTCDFPLWFVADPTDSNPGFNPVVFADQNWSAAVSGTDDDGATGALATTSVPRELISFAAIDILAADIAYTPIAPGEDTGGVNATSTAQNVGNTGLDQDVRGDSMCGTYSPSTKCPVSATSTIPEFEQQFSTIPFTWGAGTAISSTTNAEAELNIASTTATSSAGWSTGQTYWGIRVPASITLAGSYTGLNTFFARNAEDVDW